ncbi:hypothetical protein NQ317_013267 [Molorchus minor]|uniref:Uncharacterized protein n=1 Tax=Molorchus minor TaxID=1323400 RepID=A0ABQ9JXI8_9CUCU|nr:hypothetical protein NQ317_013267 [Molorchus minor]
MPTVILLDVSLSMTRPVQLNDGTETTRKQLAEIGISAFLDHLSIHSKLEFIALWLGNKMSILQRVGNGGGNDEEIGTNITIETFQIVLLI